MHEIIEDLALRAGDIRRRYRWVRKVRRIRADREAGGDVRAQVIIDIAMAALSIGAALVIAYLIWWGEL